MSPRDDELSVLSDLNDFAGDLYVTGGKTGIDGDNRNYQGDVIVSGYRLTSRQPYALGTGTTRVLPEGTLAVEGTMHGSVELAGGMLRTIKGRIEITQPLRVTESSRLDTTWDKDWGMIGEIDLPAGAQLDDGVKLTKYGEGDLIVHSDLLLGGNNSIVAFDGPVHILGTIVADGTNCRLDQWHKRVFGRPR